MSRLQSSENIKEHIGQLYSDYFKTQSLIILTLIEEWKQMYINKKTEENERFSRFSV